MQCPPFSPVLHFGLGSDVKVDSVVIEWPAGKQQILTNVDSDQVITLEEKNATKTKSSLKGQRKTIFKEKCYHDEANTPHNKVG